MAYVIQSQNQRNPQQQLALHDSSLAGKNLSVCSFAICLQISQTVSSGTEGCFKSLYLKNIDANITEDALKKVINGVIMKDEKGKLKGFGLSTLIHMKGLNSQGVSQWRKGRYALDILTISSLVMYTALDSCFYVQERYVEMLNAPKLLSLMKLSGNGDAKELSTNQSLNFEHNPEVVAAVNGSWCEGHLEVPKTQKLSSPMKLGSNGKGKDCLPTTNITLAVETGPD
ncbi:hypothetical protein SASPL_148043 [Salvia splendens]|uniref:Uncharacterized protein n=1 Tax=Salvia splendens TaxID=180675 RepID=A0A8X8Z3B2_SALSN|nr:hypothetical protein SASPL_148043 [Salvia splendens]